MKLKELVNFYPQCLKFETFIYLHLLWIVNIHLCILIRNVCIELYDPGTLYKTSG